MERITCLKSMINLKSLYISENNISSLEGVETMAELKIFNFDRNVVESLLPVKGLLKLQRINGNENKIKSLEGIENLVHLK